MGRKLITQETRVCSHTRTFLKNRWGSAFPLGPITKVTLGISTCSVSSPSQCEALAGRPSFEEQWDTAYNKEERDRDRPDRTGCLEHCPPNSHHLCQLQNCPCKGISAVTHQLVYLAGMGCREDVF